MYSCFSELHISTLEIFRLNILSKYLFFTPLDKSVSSFVFDFSSELCGNLLSLSSYFHSGQNLPKILRDHIFPLNSQHILVRKELQLPFALQALTVHFSLYSLLLEFLSFLCINDICTAQKGRNYLHFCHFLALWPWTSSKLLYNVVFRLWGMCW